MIPKRYWVVYRRFRVMGDDYIEYWQESHEFKSSDIHDAAKMDTKRKRVMSMNDQLLSLHKLIKQEIRIADKCRHNPFIDERQKNIRHGYRTALDFVEHEIRMALEQVRNADESEEQS